MREKKIFCIYCYFNVSRFLYHRRWKITSLDTIEFLDTHACINNPHWEVSGIIIFLRKYYIVISDALGGFSFGCVLFVARCNIIRALSETKKEQRFSYRENYIEEFVWGTSTLFWLPVLLFMSFVAFFVDSLPLPKWRTCWMTSIKIHDIPTGGILCDDIMSKRSNKWKSLTI